VRRIWRHQSPALHPGCEHGGVEEDLCPTRSPDRTLRRPGEVDRRRPSFRSRRLVRVVVLGVLGLASCSSGGAGVVGKAPTTRLTAPPSAVGAAGGTISSVPPLAGRYMYPLKPSPDGRYLVDQNGMPFFMVGDSAQSAAVNLTYGEAEQYFDSRVATGFNTV